MVLRITVNPTHSLNTNLMGHPVKGGYISSPDEGGPLGHLLDLSCADVGAGRPEAAEHVEHGIVHVAAVVNLHRLALARPVCGQENE